MITSVYHAIFNKKTSPLNIHHNFKVTKLLHYDMIYVYHHIQEGTVVDLTLDETLYIGEIRFKVTFKSFHLGFIHIPKHIHHMFNQVKQLNGTVSSILKEKYLPIQHLDIKVVQTVFKQVS
ncbi:hypothetical protein DNU06_03005 [Putridiphycobacter roseus]|uniref:Uncharacterized protein n=1 Tax=Putridiphycobacter roseus TaxID=2219161 RepID=A0A2W1NH18_9FLAO|nr:hypothetical protein [Putridiphycobacter roseus]PZE18815.1 hypothetical protein DNU06_03005 [Putridiphycobacter roseus]